MKTLFISINKIIFIAFILFFTFSIPVWAQKETLGITAVKPTPALVQSVDRAGKRNEMDRVLQSMNGQMIDRINATRKFLVVARSDLDDILKEQDFIISGNVDPGDKSAAQRFKLAGMKYLLVATADDFQDYNETATFQGTGRKAMKRVIRFSCVGKIYDSTNGKLLESANFQICNKDISEIKTYSGVF